MPDQQRIFLSHNAGDKDFARRLGGQLRLAGADVWFDEWEIRAGDSIPGKLDEGLGAFDTFVVVWSSHAARSNWVRHELETAMTRHIVQPAGTRIIPLRLDQTDLPAMLSRFRFIQVRDIEKETSRATMEILGLHSQRELILALQQGLQSLGLDHKEYWGVGILFGCPRCGAGLDAIEGFHATDYENDRSYAGARCRECSWEEGSET